MKKRVNCKHGLEPKEEIQARRLKDKLLSGDIETHNLLRKYMIEWAKSKKNIQFQEYLEEKEKILASAWKRFWDAI